jgi:hypothetical protein
MVKGAHACALLVTATLLVAACRKGRQGAIAPVGFTWADTLVAITGPYTGVYTVWNDPALGTYSATVSDTTLVFEPNPSSPGHFRLGGYEAFLTVQQDLSITAPAGQGTAMGDLVVHPDSFSLQFARVSYSPGGSWGSSFTGTKTY